MKKTKKILILLCALILAAQLAVNSVADGTTYTLTLNNTGETAHTFEIYQIFTGDLSVNAASQKVLSNIVWGSGVDSSGQTAFGNAAAKAETLASESDAKAFANALVSGNYLTNPSTKTVAAGSSDTVTGLAPGYYLIKDQANTQTGQGSAYTSYILEVVGNVTASPKIGLPTVEKKVKDINDTNSSDISGSAWQDSADHDIGDTIPYQITGTLPENYADYGAYYYQFNDTMSAGLTYQADAKVYVDNNGTETEITSQVTVAPSAEAAGATLSVTIADTKSLTGVTVDKDSKIIVRYTAVLNNNAVIGAAGNDNTVTLTYSNDPNPGGTGTGTTTPDKAIVFTYQITVNKVDQNNDPLPNAGFTLYKKDSNGDWQTVKTYAAGAATTFTFSGLDDGDYKLVETEVPSGFNKFGDLEFTITAVHETTADDPSLISLNSATANGDVITLAGTQQATVNLTGGVISTDIVNRSGSTLPSTGGIGTAIFYTLGGLLVIGAIILFISRKRTLSEI